jgi:hypothetical protein
MTTPISGYSSTTTTTHGTVYVYSGDAAAKAVMASMVRAEAAKGASSQDQALRAIRALNLPAEQAALIEPITLAIISTVIAGAALAATVASTAAAVSSAATGVAAMVQQANAGGLPTLEIEVENLTLSPVVPASYASNDGSTSSFIKPLNPGQSDTMVVVNSDGGFGQGDASVVIDFWAGGGVNEQGETLVPIKVVCTADYDSDGNWCPQFSIDGSPTYNNNDENSSLAMFFTSTSPNVMDFTVASMMTEKSTSSLYFMFMPGSSTYT